MTVATTTTSTPSPRKGAVRQHVTIPAMDKAAQALFLALGNVSRNPFSGLDWNDESAYAGNLSLLTSVAQTSNALADDAMIRNARIAGELSRNAGLKGSEIGEIIGVTGGEVSKRITLGRILDEVGLTGTGFTARDVQRVLKSRTSGFTAVLKMARKDDEKAGAFNARRRAAVATYVRECQALDAAPATVKAVGESAGSAPVDSEQGGGQSTAPRSAGGDSKVGPSDAVKALSLAAGDVLAIGAKDLGAVDAKRLTALIDKLTKVVGHIEAAQTADES